jgi:hypothetical protein
MHIDIEKQWKNERKSKYITSYEHNTKEWKRKEKKKVQDPKGIIKTLLVYFGNG